MRWSCNCFFNFWLFGYPLIIVFKVFSERIWILFIYFKSILLGKSRGKKKPNKSTWASAERITKIKFLLEQLNWFPVLLLHCIQFSRDLRKVVEPLCSSLSDLLHQILRCRLSLAHWSTFETSVVSSTVWETEGTSVFPKTFPFACYRRNRSEEKPGYAVRETQPYFCC